MACRSGIRERASSLHFPIVQLRPDSKIRLFLKASSTIKVKLLHNTFPLNFQWYRSGIASLTLRVSLAQKLSISILSLNANALHRNCINNFDSKIHWDLKNGLFCLKHCSEMDLAETHRERFNFPFFSFVIGRIIGRWFRPIHGTSLDSLRPVFDRRKQTNFISRMFRGVKMHRTVYSN
jgi:hypothetical protein